MDPATIGNIAASAVAVLAPYLAKAGREFAEKVGKMAADEIRPLYQAVKARLRGRPAAAEALEDLEASPDDEDARAALRLQLRKQMIADGAFADTLRRLLEEVGQNGQATTFLTQIYGGKVGRIINIGRADIVDID